MSIFGKLFGSRSESNEKYANLSNTNETDNVAKMLDRVQSHFMSGKFDEVINLCKEILEDHPNDYRVYSALSRAYLRSTPFLLFTDFDSLSENQLKLFTNYVTKSIQYGEQTLEILLKNNASEDKDLVLTTFALGDLNDALTINFRLIMKIFRMEIKTDYISEFNNNLKEKLTKYYKQGFTKFDSKFEEYKFNENLYKDINK